MKRSVLPVVLIVLGLALQAKANSIDMGKEIVTKGDTLKAVIHLDAPLKGEGELKLVWTDSWGRTVAADTQKVQVDGNAVPIQLPLARAVAMLNFLQADLTVGGQTVSVAKTPFVVTPSAVWDDYVVASTPDYVTPELQNALRDAGMNAGHIASSGTRQAQGGKDWWSYNYQYVCDQVAKDFYASYHTPSQKPKNKLMEEAKAAYHKNPKDKTMFYRQPSLSDPAALEKAVDLIKQAVTAQMKYKPYMYAHTDEGGVAELVTAWDFDFSPPALQAMRQWLLKQYGSLEAINKEWGTNFDKIDDVVPFTTDEMMAKHDDNFSPWADHRYFMNQSFADAIRAGTDAGHAIDPQSRLGLEGCQMPCAFGGYDYWLLSRAMDCIEPYNIGNNRDIWRSFAPDKPAMTTTFGAGDFEIWRLWHQALLGDLGIMIYDEKKSYLTPDAKPTPLALTILPTYRELSDGIIKQLHQATEEQGAVAIHYSQPSITAHWMIEVRPSGKAWVGRTSGSERRESEFLRLRESWTKVLEDSLHPYHFVAYAQLEDGEFDKDAAKALILPQSIAMSEKECQAVRAFVERGGTVIADCRTALMDGHCKALGKGQLDDLFGIERGDAKFAPGPAGLTSLDVNAGKPAPGLEKMSTAEPGIKPVNGAVAHFKDAKGTPAVIVSKHGKGTAIYLNLMVTDYHRWRLKATEGDAMLSLVSGLLQDAGAPAACTLSEPARAVQVFPYDSGNLKLLAFDHNYQLRSSELGPTEYQKQDELQKDSELTLKLDKPYAVYDTRAGKFLGKMDVVHFTLPKWEPAVLALLPEPAGALHIDAPATAKGGDLMSVKLKLDGEALGDSHAFHIVVTGPDGSELRPLTRTVAAPKGQVECQIPIALSDPKGNYKLMVRDVATGITAESTIAVQ